MSAVLSAAGTAALEVAHVSYSYGKRRALTDINLEIQRGESVILLGPNGAGKTTLFSLVSGLFATTSGSISIAGQSVAANGASALAPLGIVFQAQTLDLDLTVGQNLRYFCALRGLSPSEAASRIDAELARFDMASRINDKVRSLNGGHRRRVEIARAVLHQPDILLLDEPTVGLDIPTRKALIEDLHARSRRDGTALLWATHLIDEAQGCDRIVILHNGQVVANGSADDILVQTGAQDLSGAFARLTGPAEKAQKAEQTQKADAA